MWVHGIISSPIGNVSSPEDDLSELSNSEQMDGGARNKVYQRGLEYLNKGKKSSALKCFMACLTGLADKEGFSFLPQCLKHVSFVLNMYIHATSIYRNHVCKTIYSSDISDPVQRC